MTTIEVKIEGLTKECKETAAIIREAAIFIEAARDVLTVLARSYNPSNQTAYIDRSVIDRTRMMLDGKVVNITDRACKHQRELITGTYWGEVTAQDIELLFFHPHFGGRDAKLKDGCFSVIRHND